MSVLSSDMRLGSAAIGVMRTQTTLHSRKLSRFPTVAGSSVGPFGRRWIASMAALQLKLKQSIPTNFANS